MLKGANKPGRQALGRGLSSLMRSTMVDVDVAEQLDVAEEAVPDEPKKKAKPVVVPQRPVAGEEEAAAETEGDGLHYLEIARITANEQQPRQRFSQAEIDELAHSIRASGVLQPIIVRRIQNGTSEFEIVAGERRFRAAQKAGLSQIPALVRDLSDKESLELGIVENIQRADLNPVEEALAFRRLIDDFGETQAEIARTVGKDRASVANALRLLKLPQEVLELMQTGELSAGHGRALLMFADPAKQRSLAQRIVKERLSVRALEEMASSSSADGKRSKSSAKSAAKEPAVVELEGRLRRALGTKVSLSMSKAGKGELRINFFSHEELERLLERFDI